MLRTMRRHAIHPAPDNRARTSHRPFCMHFKRRRPIGKHPIRAARPRRTGRTDRKDVRADQMARPHTITRRSW